MCIVYNLVLNFLYYLRLRLTIAITVSYLVVNAESLGVPLDAVPLEEVGSFFRSERRKSGKNVAVDVVKNAVAGWLSEDGRSEMFKLNIKVLFL